MRSRGGGLKRFEGALDNECYRSVTSMVLVGNVRRNPPGVAPMFSRSVFVLPLAFALAACGPSGGADKGGKGKGGPGMGGMPPPEVTVMTVAPKAIPVSFEYVGQTAGSRGVEVRARGD